MNAAQRPIVLTAADVNALPGAPLGTIDGVLNHVLWSSGDATAGWLIVRAGHHLGAHQHREHTHHMWVLEGHAEILDTKLAAGSYVHIPPGVVHDIDARATEGCKLYYLYVR
jgi:hypothetical protein